MGSEETEEEDEEFEKKVERHTLEPRPQFQESAKLEAAIKKNTEKP